jgi:signal transduction histidine kinase
MPRRWPITVWRAEDITMPALNMKQRRTGAAVLAPITLAQIDLTDIKLARAAHDLRNRLQIAVSSFSLLRQKIKEGDVAAIHALIQAGEESVFDASTLATRLLNACHPAPARHARIEADKLLKAMLPTLHLAAGEGITIATRTACDGHMVSCDFDELQNALLNLVRNARDALGGSGDIHIETKVHTPVAAIGVPPMVGFSVTDAGCGMSPSDLARAGQPFFSTKAPGRGTGIGLASVQQFARENGGHFEIHSALGQGTTACIFLPPSHNS